MRKVLIVEDIDAMRYMMQYTLDRVEGYEVSGMAANIWEARQEVSRERPDLIFLDEILPGESSYDFLKELQADTIDVILVTGVEKPEHAIPTGALGRIVKPLGQSLERDVDRLSKSLKSILKAKL